MATSDLPEPVGVDSTTCLSAISSSSASSCAGYSSKPRSADDGQVELGGPVEDQLENRVGVAQPTLRDAADELSMAGGFDDG